MSTQPAEAELVAVCGLYCGACPVFRASGDRAPSPRELPRQGIFPSSESAAAVVGWRRAT